MLPFGNDTWFVVGSANFMVKHFVLANFAASINIGWRMVAQRKDLVDGLWISTFAQFRKYVHQQANRLSRVSAAGLC